MMTSEAAFTMNSPIVRDRELIQLDFSNDKLGIAAALRQAFTAAADDHSDCDFDKLLNDLN
jgi:hypothetical protein